MHNSKKKTAGLGAILLLISGCNASAGGEARLPDGETDLSCAALIYAATNLLDDEGAAGKDRPGFGNYVAVMTKYGTAHAESKGIGANEVLSVIKVEAYRMTGDAPGGTTVSDDTIVRRAKACMGS
jgi:hypothetical protein